MEGTRVMLLVIAIAILVGSINCKPSAIPPAKQASSLSRRNINYRNDDSQANNQFIAGVGEFLLNLLVNTFGVGLPSIGNIQQQNQMDQTLHDLLVSEIDREYQEFLTNQIPPTFQSSPRKQGSQAKASFFSSDNWEIARECINDILGADDDLSSQALISEVKDVLMGKADLNHARAQIRINWDIIRGCVDRYFDSQDNPSNTAQAAFFSYFWQSCIDRVYIMAFTGASTNALTTDPPFLELTVYDEVRFLQLPTVTGLEYQRNKGDIWALDIADFEFTESCITQSDISGIALVEGGNDGWLIDSVVTLLQDEYGDSSLLSSDIGVNSWIDGNGSQERRRLDLSIK